MNATFKGVLIGISVSALILALIVILLNFEVQNNPTTPTVSSNGITVKPAAQNSENTNTQVKKIDNSSETKTNTTNSLEQQAEINKIIALDNKYAQMETDLSEQILDLKQQMSNSPIELKNKLSYTSSEVEINRVYEETRKELERMGKQVSEKTEKLNLIKAKRQLLPLNLLRKK